MDGVENRRAKFIAVIAYFDGKDVKTFKGEVEGEIATEMRGEHGFGYDPIFLYNGRTFAEMGDEKNLVSHRRRALEVFFSSIG
jgi:XTP/dITP diphosphohydrolase